VPSWGISLLARSSPQHQIKTIALEHGGKMQCIGITFRLYDEHDLLCEIRDGIARNFNRYGVGNFGRSREVADKCIACEVEICSFQCSDVFAIAFGGV